MTASPVKGKDRTRLTDLPSSFFLARKTNCSMSANVSNRFSVLIILILCQVVFSEQPATDSFPHTAQNLIGSIQIQGIERSDTLMVKRASGLVAGTPFCSTQTDSAKTNLLRTGLFTKADIVNVYKDGRVDIYLFLEEAPSIRLSDIGGEIYSFKYGKKDRWWRMRVGVSDHNFRGRMERLSVSFSFWEWRSLGLYWNKPFVGSPYFVGLGSSISRYPHDVFSYDYRDIRARFTAGRKLHAHSRAALSIIPTMRKRMGREQKDSDGNSLTNDTTAFYEAFTILSLVNDYRSKQYDPERGFFNYTALRTNVLYRGLNNPLWELSNDLNFYLPGPWTNHKFAFRLYTVLRAGDAGSYHRLLYGGDGQVRGYHSKQIGWSHIANNSILFTTEYRFALFNAPQMYIPLLNLMFSGTNVVSWRLDGALFFDYARMWPENADIFSRNGRVETAKGFGAGLRVMFPAIQTSGCLDVAFGENQNNKSFSWPPMTYLYLNLHF